MGALPQPCATRIARLLGYVCGCGPTNQSPNSPETCIAMSLNEKLLHEGWEAIETLGFGALIGPLYRKLSETGPAFGLLAEDKHLNSAGIVHGGLLMALADHSIGHASVAATRHNGQVTVQLNTQFVSAARRGDFLVAKGQVVSETRSLVFVSGTICVGDQVVAQSSGVWKKLRARA
jgi:uncharacterized protein (TIGR00369 family)